ncbi:MAG: hypothetical protein N3B10_10070 [Armatimonadetes bacterium]|nr:hypothetical protein [Armatimonadota bacterium]
MLIVKTEQGYDHFVSVFVTSLYRYRLLFGINGRYRLIWQKDLWAILPPAVCSADLDGDGDDEVIFAGSVNRKIEVLQIVPKKGDK